MPDEGKGPEGFAKFMQDFFARDEKLGEVSEKTGEKADSLAARFKELDELIRSRTEFDMVGEDPEGNRYHSTFNHPANVFARERQGGAIKDRERASRDVKFFTDETRKLENERARIVGQMQTERLKSMLAEALEVPVGTILAPVRGAAGAAKTAVGGVKTAADSLKGDAIEIAQFTGQGIDKLGDFFSMLSQISPETHATPGAERGALMDAIFELDERGLAPMLIGFAEMLRGMSAEGSKASPRAQAAERRAGR